MMHAQNSNDGEHKTGEPLGGGSPRWLLWSLRARPWLGPVAVTALSLGAIAVACASFALLVVVSHDPRAQVPAAVQSIQDFLVTADCILGLGLYGAWRAGSTVVAMLRGLPGPHGDVMLHRLSHYAERVPIDEVVRHFRNRYYALGLILRLHDLGFVDCDGDQDIFLTMRGAHRANELGFYNCTPYSPE